MADTYKLTMAGGKGAAYAMFDKDVLRMLINELEEAPAQITQERFFELIKTVDITAKKLVAKTVADKVALFCLLHKHYKGFAYRAGKVEKANLRNVSVTEELLIAYFNATTYPLAGTKSMSDYVMHYNAVRDIATNGKPVKKSSMPEVYDMQYEKTIANDSSKLMRYWEHLRNLGWRKIEGVWINEKANG